MKYIIQISSRTRLGRGNAFIKEDRTLSRVEMSEKHDHLIKKLLELGGDWGLNENNMPRPLKFVGENLEEVSLTRYLGKGIIGTVMYKYRTRSIHEASNDDSIWLEFNSNKREINYITDVVLPFYIDAFNAYSVDVFPEALIHDIPRATYLGINKRYEIGHINQIQYVDNELCKSGFQLTPTQVALALRSVTEEVRVMEKGIMIIASRKPLTTEECIELDKKMKRLLPHKGKFW